MTFFDLLDKTAFSLLFHLLNDCVFYGCSACLGRHRKLERVSVQVSSLLSEVALLFIWYHSGRLFLLFSIGALLTFCRLLIQLYIADTTVENGLNDRCFGGPGRPTEKNVVTIAKERLSHRTFYKVWRRNNHIIDRPSLLEQ